MILGIAAAALLTQSAAAQKAKVSRVNVGKGTLYARDIGRGEPLIVLHGGPDFDHNYLLPDFDKLSDAFHLYYYDQRGRGLSAYPFEPADVTIESDVEDVWRVMRSFHLSTGIIVGHSWGTLIALEFALRHPERVQKLVLMNPAPVNGKQRAVLVDAYRKLLGPDDLERQRAIVAGAAYKEGNPDTVAARYRIHFGHSFSRPADFERLMAAMKQAFIDQGPLGILEARAVEDRLVAETWGDSTYDLLPRLRTLDVPTLVIGADKDFIPVEIARQIAEAIPKARLVTLRDCGHFSYMECYADVRAALLDFVSGKAAP